MSIVTVFQFNKQEVRVIIVNGQPWFSGEDLVTILNLPPSEVYPRVNGDEKCVVISNGINLTYISEYGLYRLLKALKAFKASVSKQFRAWVIKEVLPVCEEKRGSLEGDLGFIYLIKAGFSYYKIGRTLKPYQRFNQIKISCPLEVTTTCLILTFRHSVVEKALHNYYAKYTLRGEWFDVPPATMGYFLSVAIQVEGDLAAFIPKVEKELKPKKVKPKSKTYIRANFSSIENYIFDLFKGTELTHLFTNPNFTFHKATMQICVDHLLPHAQDIKKVLGVSLTQNSEPVAFIRNVLRLLGYKLAHKRVRMNGEQIRVYQVENPEDGREAIFARWAQRDAAATISQ